MSAAQAATAASAIYVGRVRHRRFAPRPHAFAYRLFMMYLDLDELPELFAGRWLWRHERRGLAAFHRADYLGDPRQPLSDAVRDLVAARTGRRPRGPVRMLTHLRYAGYAFNPVTFYYCWDGADAAPAAIVAEITNTPWGERHAYVLSANASTGAASTLRFGFAKRFHVSPFMPMDHEYEWRFTRPGRRLAVHMRNRRARQCVFDASLVLERRPLDDRQPGARTGALPAHDSPGVGGDLLAGPAPVVEAHAVPPASCTRAVM